MSLLILQWGLKMSLSSRLAIPAIFGGFIALFLSGVFSPGVAASAHDIGEIALISSAAGVEPVRLRERPASGAEKTGALQSRSWVWVDHCVTADDKTGWCLVERGLTRGWVEGGLLEVQWN